MLLFLTLTAPFAMLWLVFLLARVEDWLDGGRPLLMPVPSQDEPAGQESAPRVVQLPLPRVPADDITADGTQAVNGVAVPRLVDLTRPGDAAWARRGG
ncbi:MAG: hypothetical protein ACRDYU_17220 [Actinomycetes bacterium]